MEEEEEEELVIPAEILAQQKFGPVHRVPKKPDRRRRSDGTEPNAKLVEAGITLDQMLQALNVNPKLGYKLSEESIAVAIPDFGKTAAKLFYNTKSFMMDKACQGIPYTPIDLEEFRRSFVPEMNKSAALLREQTFETLKDAHLVLCQMIRSFVPGMCAVEKNTKKTKWGTTTTYYCPCQRKNRCEWKAVVCWNSETDVYSFSKISSFEKHSLDCLKYHARFSQTEVEFQGKFPLESRYKVMTMLHQFCVEETTYSMRKVRSKQNAEVFDSKLVEAKSKEQVFDPSITNLDLEDIKTKGVEIETMKLLSLLNLIRQEDKAHVKSFFHTRLNEETALSMITFIWPFGASVLATHY